MSLIKDFPTIGFKALYRGNKFPEPYLKSGYSEFRVQTLQSNV